MKTQRLRRRAPVALAAACALLMPLLTTVSAHAASTFYVSPTGTDGSAVSGASTSPFATITYCASRANAGDTCMIMPGTYRESVTGVHTGTTFQAQTPGTVRIDGSNPENWVQVSANDLVPLESADASLSSSPFAAAVSAGKVYRADVTPDTGVIPQVYVGDQAMQQAAFPDPRPPDKNPPDPTAPGDPLEPNVEVTQGNSSNTTIYDSNLTQPTDYWKGAKVYVQTTWAAQTGTVNSSSPGSIAIKGGEQVGDGCGPGVLPGSTRYFLYGRLPQLHTPNTYFYDNAAHKMYVIPADPSSLATTTVKQRLYGFDLTNVSSVTISGLNLFGTTIQTGGSAQGDTLSGLTVKYPSYFTDFFSDANVASDVGCTELTGGILTTGIILGGNHNTLRDSTISDSSGNGVALLGDHNTVTNNVIHDVDTSGGHMAGVHLSGSYQTITANTISSVGRGGIEVEATTDATATQETVTGTSLPINWRTLSNNTIEYNDIFDYARLEQDVGGIYICCSIDFSGSKIDHNWVHDSRDMDKIGSAGTIGIYLDGNAKNQSIWSNVGWNNSEGTVGVINSRTENVGVYNNNGVVYVLGVKGDSPATIGTIGNNIGPVWDGDPTSTTNPPKFTHANVAITGDPLYQDEAARDFRLKPGSAALGNGAAMSPFTDSPNCGATQARNFGAYQCADSWRPGASAAQSVVIRPQYAANSETHSPADIYPGSNTNSVWITPAAAEGRNDLHAGPNQYATLHSLGLPVDATLQLGYVPSSGGHQVDTVTVRLYARLHRQSPTGDANIEVYVGGNKVWDAGHNDFDSTGRPILIPLAANALPSSITLHCTLPSAGWTYTWADTQIDIHAVEVYMTAH